MTLKSIKNLLSLLIVFAFFLFSSIQAYAVQITLFPTADGTYSQWTPKTGTTHYTMVDEVLCNGTTDYNHTHTLNSRDSYGIDLAFIPNGSTITQIAITPCASKNNNGGSNSTASVFYRFNGVDSADSASYSLSGTTPVNLSASTYSGLSTIKGVTTTLEAGMVLTAGNKGVRLSRIATSVTYTPLAAPSNLLATASSSMQIDLGWKDNATNEDGFKVERSPDGVGSWNEIGSTSANIKTFSDTGLTPNTTYYYRVYAFNTGGNSSFSNVASATTAP